MGSLDSAGWILETGSIQYEADGGSRPPLSLLPHLGVPPWQAGLVPAPCPPRRVGDRQRSCSRALGNGSFSPENVWPLRKPQEGCVLSALGLEVPQLRQRTQLWSQLHPFTAGWPEVSSSSVSSRACVLHVSPHRGEHLVYSTHSVRLPSLRGWGLQCHPPRTQKNWSPRMSHLRLYFSSPKI